MSFNPRPVIGLGESTRFYRKLLAGKLFQSTPSHWTGRIIFSAMSYLSGDVVSIHAQSLDWANPLLTLFATLRQAFQSTPSHWTGRIVNFLLGSHGLAGFNPRPVIGLGESKYPMSDNFTILPVSIHAQSLDWANQCSLRAMSFHNVFQSTPSHWTGRI